MALDPLGRGSDVQHRERYPAIEPFNTGMLRVSDSHEIYYEECGAREGIPVVFLHGGPGGGIEPKDRQLFNPKVYRCVLFDQRGCGRSLPMGETNENDTWKLVNDIEQLRTYLKIDRWVVYGGSWGSLLAMVYGIKHAKAVRGMLIWGITYCSKAENEWLMGNAGTARILPDYYEEFANMIPSEERFDMVDAYNKRINSKDAREAKRYADAWGLWEYRACKIQIPDAPKDEKNDDDAAKGDADSNTIDQTVVMARLETHYFKHEAFVHENGRNYVLENTRAVRGAFPVIVLQGRLDLVCPSEAAWQLKKAWPEIDLRFVPDGVHSSNIPTMQDALLGALDELASRV